MLKHQSYNSNTLHPHAIYIQPYGFKLFIVLKQSNNNNYKHVSGNLNWSSMYIYTYKKLKAIKNFWLNSSGNKQ